MTETWATGRIALVTGATSGFGEAMARRLLAAGARVIATGRRAERLAALAADVKSDRLITRELDVRYPESIAELLPSLPTDFEAIDILYNNAGLVGDLDLGGADLDPLDHARGAEAGQEGHDDRHHVHGQEDRHHIGVQPQEDDGRGDIGHGDDADQDDEATL